MNLDITSLLDSALGQIIGTAFVISVIVVLLIETIVKPPFKKSFDSMDKQLRKWILGCLSIMIGSVIGYWGGDVFLSNPGTPKIRIFVGVMGGCFSSLSYEFVLKYLRDKILKKTTPEKPVNSTLTDQPK